MRKDIPLRDRLQMIRETEAKWNRSKQEAYIRGIWKQRIAREKFDKKMAFFEVAFLLAALVWGIILVYLKATQ